MDGVTASGPVQANRAGGRDHVRAAGKALKGHTHR